MFKSSKKNKLESGIIISVFIIVITLIVYYICNALELGSFSIIIALIFSIGFLIIIVTKSSLLLVKQDLPQKKKI